MGGQDVTVGAPAVSILFLHGELALGIQSSTTSSSDLCNDSSLPGGLMQHCDSFVAGACERLAAASFALPHPLRCRLRCALAACPLGSTGRSRGPWTGVRPVHVWAVKVSSIEAASLSSSTLSRGQVLWQTLHELLAESCDAEHRNVCLAASASAWPLSPRPSILELVGGALHPSLSEPTPLAGLTFGQPLIRRLHAAVSLPSHLFRSASSASHLGPYWWATDDLSRIVPRIVKRAERRNWNGRGKRRATPASSTTPTLAVCYIAPSPTLGPSSLSPLATEGECLPSSKRSTRRHIRTLGATEIFVFGSNEAGRHGKGAAKTARRWGAVQGQAEGPQGRTYGIPTKDATVSRSLSLTQINRYVTTFVAYAAANQELTFLVTSIGCGLANFSPGQIAPLFAPAVPLSNVRLPAAFWQVLESPAAISASSMATPISCVVAALAPLSSPADLSASASTGGEPTPDSNAVTTLVAVTPVVACRVTTPAVPPVMALSPTAPLGEAKGAKRGMINWMPSATYARDAEHWRKEPVGESGDYLLWLLRPDGFSELWFEYCDSKQLASLNADGVAIPIKGLWARRGFRAHDLLTVFTGPTLSRGAFETLREEGGGHHVMELCGQLIDGQHAVQGAACINDPRGLNVKPNVKFCNAPPGHLTSSVRAVRNIAAGEELLVSYGGRTYWDKENRQFDILRCVRGEKGREATSPRVEPPAPSPPIPDVLRDVGLRFGSRVAVVADNLDLSGVIGCSDLLLGKLRDAEYRMGLLWVEITLDSPVLCSTGIGSGFSVIRHRDAWASLTHVSTPRSPDSAPVVTPDATEAETEQSEPPPSPPASPARETGSSAPADTGPHFQAGGARMPPQMPFRDVVNSLVNACSRAVSDAPDIDEGIDAFNQTNSASNLDGVVWWVSKMQHNLPPQALPPLRAWCQRLRVSVAVFAVRPLQTAAAIEELVMQLLDILFDLVYNINGQFAFGDRRDLLKEAEDRRSRLITVLDYRNGSYEYLSGVEDGQPRPFALGYGIVWRQLRRLLVDSNKSRAGQLPDYAVPLGQFSTLVPLIPWLLRLSEAAEPLEQTLPDEPLTLSQRHLRAPAVACAKTGMAYGAKAQGAARLITWAIRQHLAGKRIVVPTRLRPTRCGRGLHLASEPAFAAQRKHADAALHMAAFLVKIYELSEGVTPAAMVLGCGAGSASEGIARVGGEHFGLDKNPQPEFIRSFGADRFRLADIADDRSTVWELAARPGVISAFITFDCQLYSTINLAAIKGAPSEHTQFISESGSIAGRLVDMGYEVACENTRGAGSVMTKVFPHVTELRGDLFGLRSSRPRIIGSAPTPIDISALRGDIARDLHKGMCNGQWRVMPHLDAYGRADREPCCSGNTVPLHGKTQPRLPIGLLCDAVGLKPDAMGWGGLTQAMPPAYSSFVFGHHVSSWLTRHRGMPAMPLDAKMTEEDALPALREWASAQGILDEVDALVITHFSARPLSGYVRSTEAAIAQHLDGLPTHAHRHLSLGVKKALGVTVNGEQPASEPRVPPEASQPATPPSPTPPVQPTVVHMSFKQSAPYRALVVIQSAVRRRFGNDSTVCRTAPRLAASVLRSAQGNTGIERYGTLRPGRPLFELSELDFRMLARGSPTSAFKIQHAWRYHRFHVTRRHAASVIQRVWCRCVRLSGPPARLVPSKGSFGCGIRGVAAPRTTSQPEIALQTLKEANAALDAMLLGGDRAAPSPTISSAPPTKPRARQPRGPRLPSLAFRYVPPKSLTASEEAEKVKEIFRRLLPDSPDFPSHRPSSDTALPEYAPASRLHGEAFKSDAPQPPDFARGAFSLSRPALPPASATSSAPASCADEVALTPGDHISLMLHNSGVLQADGSLCRVGAVLDTGSMTSAVSYKRLLYMLAHAAPGAVMYKPFATPRPLGVEVVGGGAVNQLGNASLDLYIENRLYRILVPVLDGGDLLILGNDFCGQRCTGLNMEGETVRLKHCFANGVCTEFWTPALHRLVSAINRTDIQAVRACAAVVNETQQFFAYPEAPLTMAKWSQQVVRLRVPAGIRKGIRVLVERLGAEGPNRTSARVGEGIYEVTSDGYVDVNISNPNLFSPTYIDEGEPIARIHVSPEVAGDVQSPDMGLEELMDSLTFGEHLTGVQIDSLRPRLAARLHYFSMKRLGCHHGTKHTIPTPKVDAGVEAPPFQGPRRLAPEQYEAAWSEFNKLRDLGVFRPASGSPYGAPVVMIKKPKGGWRMAIDFKKLNAVTSRASYPLPDPTGVLAAIGKANWLSAIDCSMAFHQLEVADEDKEKCTVSFPWGQWSYERMPFGLVSASLTFQRCMDSVLSGLLWTDVNAGICLCYIDDICVFTEGTFEQHVDDLLAVLDRLAGSGFILKPSKCQIGCISIELLGRLVSPEGTSVLPSKVQAINDLAPNGRHASRKDAKRFVMMAQYHAPFIPNFSQIAAPVHALAAGTGKDFEAEASSLAVLASTAALKHALTTAPCLMRCDFSKPKYLEVDSAPSRGIGAMFSQKDDAGNLRPIGFWSQRFTDSETRWSVTQAECAGVCEAVHKFRREILASPGPTTVYTDHAALQYLLTAKHLTGAMARMALQLSEYDLIIIHRPGALMVVSDALSRLNPSKGVQRSPAVEDLARYPLLPQEDDAPSTLAAPPAETPTVAAIGLWAQARVSRAVETVCLVLLDARGQRVVTLNTSSRQHPSRDLPGGTVTTAETLHTAAARAAGSVTELSALSIDWSAPVDSIFIGSVAYLFYPLAAPPSAVAGGRVSLPTFTDMAGMADRTFACSERLRLLLHLWDAAAANGDEVLPHPVMFDPTKGPPITAAAAAVSVVLPSRRKPIPWRRRVAVVIQRGLSSLVVNHQNGSVSCPSRDLVLGQDGSLASVAISLLTERGMTTESAVAAVDTAVRVARAGSAHYFILNLTEVQCTRLLSHTGVLPWGWRETDKVGHLQFAPGRQGDLAFLQRLTALHRSLPPTTPDPSDQQLECHMATLDPCGRPYPPGSLPADSPPPILGRLADNARSCVEALQDIWQFLRNAPEDQRIAAIDLEGPLRDTGRIDLFQITVGPHTVIFDLVTSDGIRALDSTPTSWGVASLRVLLGDVSIVKVFHSGHGDTRSLWAFYGVRVLNIWDTCVADSILKPADNHHHRGLGTVITDWLDVVLSEKGKLDFHEDLFRQRPMTAQILLYSAEDVFHSTALYLAQLATSRERNVAAYVTMASVTFWWPLQDASLRVSVLPHDDTHALLADGDNGLDLISMPLERSQFDCGSTTRVARELWASLNLDAHLPLPKGVPRGTRLGGTFLHAPRFASESLSTGFSDAPQAGMRLIRLDMLPDASCISMDVRACLERTVHMRHPSPSPAAGALAVSYTLPRFSAAILHDSVDALACCSTEGLSAGISAPVLPRICYQGGLPGSVVSRQALLNKLGPLEECSAKIALAVTEPLYVGRFGDTCYYAFEVDSLRDCRADIWSAWRQRSTTPSDEKAWMAPTSTPLLSPPDWPGLAADAAVMAVVHGLATLRRRLHFEAAIVRATAKPLMGSASLLSASCLALLRPAPCDASSAPPSFVLTPCVGLQQGEPGGSSVVSRDTSPVELGVPQPRAPRSPARCTSPPCACRSPGPGLQQGPEPPPACRSPCPGLQQGLAPAAGVFVAKAPAPPDDCEHPIFDDLDALVALRRIPGMAPEINTAAVMQAQLDDDFCKKHIAALLNMAENDKPQRLDASLYYLRANDTGVLLFRQHEPQSKTLSPVEQLVVPTSLREAYLRAFHDRLAHVGISRTTQVIGEHAWWPKLKKEIRRYIRRCPTCCMIKRCRIRAGQARSLGNGEHPGDVWMLDMLDLDETSRTEHRKALVFICRFSRWAEAIARKTDPTAEEVIGILLDRVIRVHGFPRAVVMDRGSNLIAGLAKNFYKATGIQMVTSDSYMHNTLGLVERLNGTLKDFLRAYIFDTGSTAWEQYLPYALLSYNTTAHATTGLSPFYILFGRDARFPIDLALLPSWSTDVSMEDYTVQHARAIYAAWESSRLSLAAAAAKARVHRNASSDVTFKLQVGDRVLIRKPNVQGLEAPHHGPYRVTETLENDRVRVRDLHRVMHDEFHISKLKLYPYVDNDGNMAAAVDEYLVEDIIGKKIINNIAHYRVKWTGWDATQCLWLPVHELDPTVLDYVEAYEVRLAAAAGVNDSDLTKAEVEAKPVSNAPIMRSHVEHHLDAAPPGFVPDRGTAPPAALRRRAGKNGKRQPPRVIAKPANVTPDVTPVPQDVTVTPPPAASDAVSPPAAASPASAPVPPKKKKSKKKAKAVTTNPPDVTPVTADVTVKAATTSATAADTTSSTSANPKTHRTTRSGRAVARLA